MATITNNSLSKSISMENLINYVLTDSDDPVFNALASDSIPSSSTLPENLKRKTIDHLNQPIAKKTCVLSPSLSSPENSATMKLRNDIKQVYKKANASSLEKIQIHYANQLKVDLQEMKNIYFAISTNDPSADEPSEIKQRHSIF